MCGFANAQGGTVYIGIDDAGNVVGVQNVKKLLEDIPNKIQSGLGIVADVNKLTKDGKDYLEIKVKPSSFPISYHGEFHYRSGATKQQLTGIALSEFIMRKTGARWEDVTGADILYQDMLEESLISTADKVVDLIFLKYLKAKITFEHDRRRETYPYAREAVREAVYNAIIHNCYMYGSPIQIRIEDDAMIISNCCILPEGWTVDTFMQPHNSRPYNPDIANVFYRAGYIEHWGRGIQKICDACKELGAEPPVYELLGNGLRVHFKALESALIDESKTPKRHNEVLDGVLDETLADRIIEVLKNNPRITQKELVIMLNIPYRTLQRKMDELKAEGKIIRKDGKRFGYWEVN